VPNEPWGPDTAKLWSQAWGGNKALVMTEYNQRMPTLPDDYSWLVTRDIDIVRKVDAQGNKQVDVFPKVEVSLLHVPDDPDGFKTVAHNVLDVKIYGENPVGLAESILDYTNIRKRIR
jgi:hypothetical protein